MKLKEINQKIDYFINDENRDNHELRRLLNLKLSQLDDLELINKLVTEDEVEEVPHISGNLYNKLSED